MNNRIVVIPTGDEILNGIVLDTDSPQIKSLWLENHPDDIVTITEAVSDDGEIIAAKIMEAAADADIIVMIGGSGGGHRHDQSLGKDFTHTALDRLLDPKAFKSIYGPNGHMWCRLVIGFVAGAVVLNVPGPFTEAKAAFTAFRDICEEDGIPKTADEAAIKRINESMADAVIKTYER